MGRRGALTLELPPLRSRSDEIPSLSSLYLNSLNLELGKQLSGFEPRAIEMLRQYPWPNNYTQFKNLLRSLATLTNGPYIRSSSVADLLSKERSLRSAPAAHPAGAAARATAALQRHPSNPPALPSPGRKRLKGRLSWSLKPLRTLGS